MATQVDGREGDGSTAASDDQSLVQLDNCRSAEQEKCSLRLAMPLRHLGCLTSLLAACSSSFAPIQTGDKKSHSTLCVIGAFQKAMSPEKIAFKILAQPSKAEP